MAHGKLIDIGSFVDPTVPRLVRGDAGRLRQILRDSEFHAHMSEISVGIGRQHQTLAHGMALTQALSVLAASQ